MALEVRAADHRQFRVRQQRSLHYVGRGHDDLERRRPHRDDRRQPSNAGGPPLSEGAQPLLAAPLDRAGLGPWLPGPYLHGQRPSRVLRPIAASIGLTMTARFAMPPSEAMPQ